MAIDDVKQPAVNCFSNRPVGGAWDWLCGSLDSYLQSSTEESPFDDCSVIFITVYKSNNVKRHTVKSFDIEPHQIPSTDIMNK